MIEAIERSGQSETNQTQPAEGAINMLEIEPKQRRYAAADSAAGGIAILKDRLVGAIQRLRRRRPIRTKQASIRSPSPG